MKVYINHRTGGYSGGLIIVAANSPEEAHGTIQDVSYDGDKPKMLAEGGYTE